MRNQFWGDSESIDDRWSCQRLSWPRQLWARMRATSDTCLGFAAVEYHATWFRARSALSFREIPITWTTAPWLHRCGNAVDHSHRLRKQSI